MATKTDSLFKGVSDRVVSGILSGEMPWQKNGTPPLIVKDDKVITGINYLLLSQANKSDPRWCLESEAKQNGWSIKEGNSERYALFSRPASEYPESSVRRIVGAKMFNYSQLNGPDIYVMTRGSSLDTGYLLLSTILNSGRKIDVSEDVDYTNGVFTLALPKSKEDGSVDIDRWNADLIGALSKYGYIESIEDGADVDTFVVNAAKTMLCAEYGVPVLNNDLNIVDEDIWVEKINNDEKYVFKAANAASLICAQINQLSPSMASPVKILSGQQDVERNNSLFEEDVIAANDDKENNELNLIDSVNQTLSSLGFDIYLQDLESKLNNREHLVTKMTN